VKLATCILRAQLTVHSSITSVNMTNPFATREPAIEGNGGLRIPQREAYAEMQKAAAVPVEVEREVAIVLPVGCGKSGCIALAPFAFKAKRTLVLAPGLTIADQLNNGFDPTNPDMFYTKSGALATGPFPEPVEIRGTTTNRADLDAAHVVITNIQQLQGAENRWLQNLPSDYFDLILIDEGHHNVADSWETLRAKFPAARIVNFSATPLRADGQLMSGRVIYSYPVARAIQEGYVKHLKAVVLNPRSLRYVRQTDGAELDVTLDEVRRLGEDDADFRRSIVTSKATLDTIVDASIRQLNKLRDAASEPRLKIIASVLNYAHCAQVVAAYRARGLRADFVHSREDTAANQSVMTKLSNHELDVIVQVRKLGEGFDHKYLAVAAVFSVFSNLSPFIQFVGRVMRVVKQNASGDPANQGAVVFHAGANIARRWDDFRSYSDADQKYFDELLPVEDLDFTNASELEVTPRAVGAALPNPVNVRSQTGVQLEEIPLIQDDPDALAALKLLRDKGYSTTELLSAFEDLQPVPVSKVRERQSKRLELVSRVNNEAGRLLREKGLSPEGRDLDRKRIGHSNFVAITSAIHSCVNKAVNRTSGERSEFTKEDLDHVERDWATIIADASREVFDVQP
jgi:superfamily II DNA or RNA helicase